jgi:hypothetical protein
MSGDDTRLVFSTALSTSAFPDGIFRVRYADSDTDLTDSVS